MHGRRSGLIWNLSDAPGRLGRSVGKVIAVDASNEFDTTMNDRSFAISVLQKARDALSERLTQRVIESRDDIEADAAGESYLSEIETIYEQIGGRLAHLNAMLSNLPPATTTAAADPTASEVIYADLATAYPCGLEPEPAPSARLLGLPAPARAEESTDRRAVVTLQNIVRQVQAADLATASTLICELFDIKPSQARRAALALTRQIAEQPELARRIEELEGSMEAANEYTTATLLGECFAFQPIDALSFVRTLKERSSGTDDAR